MQGLLTRKDIPAVSELLGTQNEVAQIGVMLGFCISMRGSWDDKVQKVPFLHLPQYHPASFPEADWSSSSVQAAALLSVGFLCAKLKESETAKQLKKEIARRYSKTKRMLNELRRRAGPPPPNARPESVHFLMLVN